MPFSLPRNTAYDRLGIAPDATAEDVREAAAGLAARLAADGAPASEIASANGLDLERPDSRAAHDRLHPPLGLLRIQPTWSPIFDDRARAINALRRDLERFLTDHGMPACHISDLTRTDFSDEFTYSRLLDGPPDTDKEFRRG
ncbi:hypothetical protein GCM10009539_75790 [Cryptosporangium japonicum]|uniref:Uncharacterized protein n=2 Tax=Cryptosporangium japonicum TaxID=80872 RepID=A0ABN0V5U3_9ACTN